MNSPKHNLIVPEKKIINDSAENEIESVTENEERSSKVVKKTASPGFSIDSLILRKKTDLISGK